VVVVALCLCAIAAPAAATAKPGDGGAKEPRHAVLRFPASHGYHVEVTAPAGSGGPFQLVFVTVKNGPVTVTYAVDGSLDASDSIDVHLPHVGRIAVRFDPVHVTRKPLRKGCRGEPQTIEHGYFRGTIALRGERGYMTVDRSSVHGIVVSGHAPACRGTTQTESGGIFGRVVGRMNRAVDKGGSPEDLEVTALAAGSEDASTTFMALLVKDGTKTVGPVLVALKTSFREGMLISTNVSETGRPADLTRPEEKGLKSADLTASEDLFDGSAAFTLTSPKTSTWKGDLAAELPGQGRVALAGKDFWSILCEGGRCTKSGGELGSIFAAIIGILGG
jgi:hypothetical protein